MAGAPERELKFEVNPGASIQTAMDVLLRSAPQGHLSAPRIQQLESTYFDTPGLDLRARGMVLRVRRSGDRYIQTIKRAACTGGSFERWESEREIAGPAPQLSADDRTAFGDIALRRGKRAFRPVFTVKSERTIWAGEADGVGVEVAFDRGEIDAGGAKTALCELEIELKKGSARNLFDMGRRLVAQAHLRPTTFTKDERGYRLLDETWGHAARQGKAPVKPGMGPRAAFHAIALDCLHHFLLNERVVRGACDGDAIHQARIAIRRLRSALSLFRPVVEDGRFEEIKADLKALSDALGAVRDLSVFEQRILQPARAEHGALLGLEALADEVVRSKQARYAALQAELESPERQQKLIGLIEWVEAGDWRSGVAPENESAVRFARRRLRKIWRGMVRDSAQLQAAPDAAIHDLRKRAKRLRYAEEFFEGALKGKARRRAQKRALQALGRVQKNLGHRQDMVAARQTLAALVSGGVTAEVGFAAGHLHGQLGAKLTGLRGAKLKKAAADIAAARPR